MLEPNTKFSFPCQVQCDCSPGFYRASTSAIIMATKYQTHYWLLKIGFLACFSLVIVNFLSIHSSTQMDFNQVTIYFYKMSDSGNKQLLKCWKYVS